MCYFLCYFYRMKLTETDSNKNTLRIDAQSTREPVKYQKVYDGRKRRIRGLWNRGGAFYAQLSLPNADGVRKMRRVKLNATTVASATDELRRMVIDRDDDQLPAMVRKPRFDNYAQDYIDRVTLPLGSRPFWEERVYSPSSNFPAVRAGFGVLGTLTGAREQAVMGARPDPGGQFSIGQVSAVTGEEPRLIEWSPNLIQGDYANPVPLYN